MNESYKRWHKPQSFKTLYNEDGSLKKGKTHQGKYFPRNKEKYIGDLSLIVYRSSWEYSFCKWCDHTPSVLRWSSEPIKVPYLDPAFNLEECRKLGIDPNNPKNWKLRNYYTDFWVEMSMPDGNIERWFIEIKPSGKLKQPVPPSQGAPLKLEKRFVNEAKEYITNKAKFEALEKWAVSKRAKFYVFTEKELERYGIIGGIFDIKEK